MRRQIGISLVLGMLLVMPTASAHDWVDRAVATMGGAKALGAIKTIRVQGTTKQWEPEQSYEAGGEKRYAGESVFTLSRDFRANAARTDWQRKLVYPAPREYQFSEIVAGANGYVAGIDATARTKQSLDANPPAHTMSRVRVATTLRELERTSLLLLLDMQRKPQAVTLIPDVKVGNFEIHRASRYRAVRYSSGANVFIVMFDDYTGLPIRIRTLDYDAIEGDSNYDLVLSDWRDVGGVKLPHRQVYELNGTVVIETAIQSVDLNPRIEAKTFAIPTEYRLKPAKPGPATVPYQWVLRRQFIGTYLDSDAIAYDPRASQGLRLTELAPGVQIVQGGSHNSLIVEMQDYLVVFDAPISDAQSEWTIKAASEKFSGKPVKFLVLTHHHMDHAGGTRAYVMQGAALVVGVGNGTHFRKMIHARHVRSPDLPEDFQGDLRITEVSDRFVLSDGDGKREVSAYLIENPHAAGMLIGYVSDAKLGFVTDLWSPGRDPLPPQPNPALTALVKGVKRHGLAPERFAGGHGSVAAYAPLEKLIGG